MRYVQNSVSTRTFVCPLVTSSSSGVVGPGRWKPRRTLQGQRCSGTDALAGLIIALCVHVATRNKQNIRYLCSIAMYLDAKFTINLLIERNLALAHARDACESRAPPIRAFFLHRWTYSWPRARCALDERARWAIPVLGPTGLLISSRRRALRWPWRTWS